MHLYSYRNDILALQANKPFKLSCNFVEYPNLLSTKFSVQSYASEFNKNELFL